MNRRSRHSSAWVTWLGGAALGAVAMYLSDPDRGKRRRALAKNKMQSLMSQTGSAIDVASRDLGNRMQGLRAQANRMMRTRHEEIDDDILVARVRSKIGRAISHPHAIKVHAEQGSVILSGPILPNEKKSLVAAARSVPGAIAVEDHTEVHETPDVPSLQGQGRLRQARPILLHDNWPPALRACATLGGGIMGLYGLARRSPTSVMLAALGLGLVARGVSNTPLTRMAGRQMRRQPILLERSVYIAASPEAVFDVWSNYENFPRFMSNVKEVSDMGNRNSHWSVSGPAGAQIEWDAELTHAERGRMLAWKTRPGSTIEHMGAVRFAPEAEGTRVDVEMSYHMPAGAAGDAMASLFNGNPERQMEDDLMQMKTFIESGMPSSGAARSVEQSNQMLH
ncbi:SRPBCC family protein [Noviherbaspirillum cavernae]|nr:SRPBCC family protein [Noviherbaspirillum cavernae]